MCCLQHLGMLSIISWVGLNADGIQQLFTVCGANARASRGFLVLSESPGELGKNTEASSPVALVFQNSGSPTSVTSKSLAEASKFTEPRSHPRPSK